MESYVYELKEVIRNMPETDQASQFITALEPFYKVAYAKGEKSPPIFNIFHKKQDRTPVIKMNGHALPLREIGDNHKLNTSHASKIHNISETVCNGQSNDIENTGTTGSSLSNGDMNGFIPRKNDLNGASSNDHVVINGDLGDSNKESNGNKDMQDDTEEEDDDDDLFCDSLGPELLEEQNGQVRLPNSAMLESVPEDIVPLNDRCLSSFSDVEILEQFDMRKNGGSSGETSSPHSDKMVHVHFEDLNTSEVEGAITHHKASKEHGVKECVVQPNQVGAGSGAGDSKGPSRATGSGGKHTQRNAQYSERSTRYGQRYRRRSQESDSDESPGRSDHNSSSERDDVAIDRIADLLIEIQDNMKKILDRLKRLETSLQQSQSISWFENYRPSKTFLFLILWPFIVNFLFKFLRRRFSTKQR
ncbi:acyl-CoA-binding domain-containing protein 5-like isoform X2 [Dendronephthya gigantea]|nr:acyl-CoA-binding domain-containing protein 5-like isoform X2 [Dendronephthya gigantea]